MTAGVLQAAAFRALGTAVDVRCTAEADLAAAVAAVRAELERVDRAYSRFRGDSELTRANTAGGRAVRISPLFAEAVACALRAAALSGGAVDPTVGAALCRAGYDVDFAEVAPEGPPVALVSQPVPGWRSVELDERELTLRLPAGVMLDLGATGKALAADRAATAAAEAGGGGVLVNIGGDMAVSGRLPEQGWAVRLAAEEDDAADGEVVRLYDGAVATSGTTARRWMRGGRALHHLIDPWTGLPALECWAAVSVVAGSCVDANIAATATVVLGERGLQWLADTGLSARCVRIGGTVEHVGPWECAL